MTTLLVIGMGIVASSTAAATDPGAALIPGMQNAGRAYADRVGRAADLEARDGLAQFDLWMKFHPTDAAVAA